MRFAALLALAATLPAQTAAIRHAQAVYCGVRLKSFRQFASVSDPIPFEISWANHDYPATGYAEVAIVAIGTSMVTPPGPSLVCQEQLAISFSLAPAPGTVFAARGNGIWDMSVDLPPFLVGWTFFVQLHTGVSGISEVLEFEVNP
jgi:hypothetical protein